jgi:hypothetical protein
METFKEAEQGDFIIYTDCSPEMWNEERIRPIPGTKLNPLLDLCASNRGILSSFIRWDTVPLRHGQLGIHTHRHFTTDRCMRVMGMMKYENSFMHASGMVVLQKNKLSSDFLSRWLIWNLRDECSALGRAELDNDYSFWDQEDEHKMGHRHDQSISGLLLNEMNPLLVDYYERNYPGHNFLNYCYDHTTYTFTDSNTVVKENRNRIFKGDWVTNEKGVKLRVFEIRSINNVEHILVGLHRESLYMTTPEHLTKVA